MTTRVASMGLDSPSWIAAILAWRWTWLAARVVLTAAYLYGGFVKLFNFDGAIAEQEHFGLHPGWLWAALAIVVELGGSALVISGRFVWLGAGAIGVLTAIATIVADDFWNTRGAARVMVANTFLEHLGLIAGLVLVAIMSERAAADVRLQHLRQHERATIADEAVEARVRSFHTGDMSVRVVHLVSAVVVRGRTA